MLRGNDATCPLGIQVSINPLARKGRERQLLIVSFSLRTAVGKTSPIASAKRSWAIASRGVSPWLMITSLAPASKATWGMVAAGVTTRLEPMTTSRSRPYE